MKKIFALLMALLVCVCLMTLAVTAIDGDASEAAESASQTDADISPTPIPTDTSSDTDADPTSSPTDADPTPSPVPTAAPTPASEVSISFSPDGRTAVVAGDWTGLYARVALILDNSGVTGLYVTQCVINDSGTIIIPTFMIPGLTVKGVNVALVTTLEEIPSPAPRPVAIGTVFF